ncbi:MAG: type II toxin-antitoxin system PemK/MazF family toxin [Rectinemataceae bacterium]
MPSYGDIWLADLNPRQGTEPGKVRPVLILQNQALLDIDHPSTLVLPLSTNLIDEAEPLRVRIPAQGRLERDSDALIDQLRAIDNVRLRQGPLVTLDAATLARVAMAVREVLGFS